MTRNSNDFITLWISNAVKYIVYVISDFDHLVRSNFLYQFLWKRMAWNTLKNIDLRQYRALLTWNTLESRLTVPEKPESTNLVLEQLEIYLSILIKKLITIFPLWNIIAKLWLSLYFQWSQKKKFILSEMLIERMYSFIVLNVNVHVWIGSKLLNTFSEFRY